MNVFHLDIVHIINLIIAFFYSLSSPEEYQAELLSKATSFKGRIAINCIKHPV